MNLSNSQIEDLMKQLENLNLEKDKIEQNIKELDQPKLNYENYKIELNNLLKERQDWMKKIFENYKKILKVNGVQGVINKIEELKQSYDIKLNESSEIKKKLKELNRRLDELI